MTSQATRAKRKITSTKIRDYSGPGRGGPKILTLSQMHEEQRQLDERRRKAEHRMTALLRKKIAGVGMIANKSQNEREDVVEDDGVTDMQDKTAARHATLQITRVKSWPRSRELRRRSAEREWTAIMPSLVDPYLEWKSTRVTSRPETESDNVWPIPVLGIKAGSSHTVSVRQREEENPVVSLMHVGLIPGTPCRPNIAFSVDVLDAFYDLRREQPNVGVRGFVKSICASQQFKYVNSIDQLFSRAFDVYSEMQRRLQTRDNTTLEP